MLRLVLSPLGHGTARAAPAAADPATFLISKFPTKRPRRYFFFSKRILIRR